MNALILAAGLGTRLGDYTQDRPKALVELNGHTMLEYQLRHLAAAGFDHFAINIHHFSEKVREYLESNGNFGLDITLSDETGLLLDTGGGIRKAMHLFSNTDPVLVHNVDIFSDTDLRELYQGHCKSGAHATLLVEHRNTSRYLYFDSSDMLCGWSNEKTGQVRSPLADFDKSDYIPCAFQGIHVLSHSILEHLDRIPQEQFGITDFYVDHACDLKLRAVLMKGGRWVDAGKPDTLESAAGIACSW